MEKHDLDNNLWYSCQIYENYMFQLENNTNLCRILQFNGTKYTMIRRQNRRSAATQMSICYVPKDFVISIGGHNNHGGSKSGAQDTVEFHDLRIDSWTTTGNSYLNIGRFAASSCVQGQSAYVFGG